MKLNETVGMFNNIDDIWILLIGQPTIKPMVILIWCGESKPNNLNDFLFPFVNELEELHITLKIRCFT